MGGAPVGLHSSYWVLVSLNVTEADVGPPAASDPPRVTGVLTGDVT